MQNSNPDQKTTDQPSPEREWTERMKAEGRLDPFDPIELAAAAERECCARIADEYIAEVLPVDPGGVARIIAGRIRDRANMQSDRLETASEK